MSGHARYRLEAVGMGGCEHEETDARQRSKDRGSVVITPSESEVRSLVRCIDHGDGMVWTWWVYRRKDG